MLAAVLAAAVLLPPVSGAFNYTVKQATLDVTACRPGWAATVRPSVAYTSRIKYQLLQDQDLPGTVASYQLDHLVSLSLGGAPRSLRNLWMQPWSQARRDDRLEWRWHHDLCAGTITLRQAWRIEIRYKAARG